MFHRDAGVPGIVAALRCTLALAAVGLNHHDCAGLFAFAQKLEVLSKPKSGPSQILPVARQLAQLAARPPGDRTDLPVSLRRLASLNLRRGLVVLISDFFDPGGPAALHEALRALRHRVVVIQLVRAADATPKIGGDVRLTDCESGEATDLTITPRVLARYQAAYKTFNNELSRVARARRAHHVRIDVEADLIVQLAPLFEPGAVSV